MFVCLFVFSFWDILFGSEICNNFFRSLILIPVLFHQFWHQLGKDTKYQYMEIFLMLWFS